MFGGKVEVGESVVEICESNRAYVGYIIYDYKGDYSYQIDTLAEWFKAQACYYISVLAD